MFTLISKRKLTKLREEVDESKSRIADISLRLSLIEQEFGYLSDLSKITHRLLARTAAAAGINHDNFIRDYEEIKEQVKEEYLSKISKWN